MQANQQEHATDQVERARKSARRTAWWLAGIAFALYAGFMVIGAIGK